MRTCGVISVLNDIKWNLEKRRGHLSSRPHFSSQ